jgi:hypothetical protein
MFHAYSLQAEFIFIIVCPYLKIRATGQRNSLYNILLFQKVN